MQCFSHKLNPARFKPKYLQILRINLEMSQDKNFREEITLHVSFYAPSLIQPLSCPNSVATKEQGFRLTYSNISTLMQIISPICY